MAARPLLAVLIGLVAALLLGPPAAAGHAHHEGVQAEHPVRQGPADMGCCTTEGAHCASPTGLAASTAIVRPPDSRAAGVRPLEVDGPGDCIPDLQPKPPRA